MSLLSSHSVCTQLQSRRVGAGGGRWEERGERRKVVHAHETWVSVAVGDVLTLPLDVGTWP
jgi:hypothetical protein